MALVQWCSGFLSHFSNQRNNQSTNVLPTLRVANDQDVCRFLGLPLELREQIYSYLLSTKYNRQDVLHKAPVLDTDHPINRRYLHRPGHVYHFQTAILRTNRQIHEEASMIFYKANQFAAVYHNLDMLIHSAMERRLKSMGLRGIFEQRGFPILTTDETVRDFKHLAMGIQVLGERTRRSRSGQLWKQTKPEDWGSWQIFMIACDDLEQFCGVVLYISHYMRMPTYYSRLIEMHLGLTVDIVAQDYHSPLPLKNDTAVQPSIQRLLEPLRRLHKVYTVLIRGPASETYKENVKKSIMREAPTAEEMITTACELKALGEDAFRKADFRSCVYTYEKAISDLEAGCQLCDPSTLVTEGKYSGSRVSKASRHLYFMLQLDLVTALLRLQSYDRAHNWTMVEAQMGGGVTSDAELAQMWYLRAQASREMGIIDRAHDELAQAVTLQPDRNDMAADFGRLTIEAFRSSKATMRWKLSSREYSYRLRTVRYMSLFFFATFSVFWWRRRP